MQSIEQFGFTNPVLVDEAGVLIAGHVRLVAAKELGLAEVPTITLEGLFAMASGEMSDAAFWQFLEETLGAAAAVSRRGAAARMCRFTRP